MKKVFLSILLLLASTVQAQDATAKSNEEIYKQLLDLQKKQLEDTSKGIQDTALQTEIKKLRKILCDQKQHKLFVTKITDKKTNLAQLVTECSRSELLAISGKKNNDGKLDQVTQAYLIPIGDPEKYMAMLFNDKGQPEKIQLSDKTEINFTNYTTKSTEPTPSKQSGSRTNNIRADIEIKFPNGQTKIIKNHDLGIDNEKFSDATKFIGGKKHDDDHYRDSCLDEDGAKDEQCQPPSVSKSVSLIVSGFSCAVATNVAINTGGFAIPIALYGCTSFLANAAIWGLEASCKKPPVALQLLAEVTGDIPIAIDCLGGAGKCLLSIGKDVMQRTLINSLDNLVSKKNQNKKMDKLEKQKNCKPSSNDKSNECCYEFEKFCKEQRGVVGIYKNSCSCNIADKIHPALCNENPCGKFTHDSCMAGGHMCIDKGKQWPYACKK